MATVDVMTSARVDEITNALVATGTIDVSNHIILTTRLGTQIDVGAVQAANTDLTTIAGLTPADNDILQRKAAAWTNRTPAQVAADLIAAFQLLTSQYYNGSAYAPSAIGAAVYVGNTDPTLSLTVQDGSVWFQTV